MVFRTDRNLISQFSPVQTQPQNSVQFSQFKPISANKHSKFQSFPELRKKTQSQPESEKPSFKLGLFEILGGKGSGHHGHAGIPGKRGGSSSKGSTKKQEINTEVKKHRKPLDLDEANISDTIERIMIDTGVDESIASNFAMAIGSYQDATREIRNQMNPLYKDMYNDIQEYIDKSPKWGNGLLLRGVSVDKAEATKLTKGNIVDMKGLSSWTSDLSVARDFAKQREQQQWKSQDVENVVFRMPKGTMNGAAISHLSWLPEEKEVIVGKRAKLKITGKKRTPNGFLVIQVEDVG